MVHTLVFQYFDAERVYLCVHGDGSIPDVRAALLASFEWSNDDADEAAIRIGISTEGCRNRRHKGFLHAIGRFSYHNYYP